MTSVTTYQARNSVFKAAAEFVIPPICMDNIAVGRGSHQKKEES